jgi:hypothetical protein
MSDYCLIFAIVKSSGEYPTDKKLKELGKTIPHIQDKCLECSARKEETCIFTCKNKVRDTLFV